MLPRVARPAPEGRFDPEPSVASLRDCIYNLLVLLNVRLTSEEERAVRGLRRAKVNVSELVRRALREAAAGEKHLKVKRSVLVQEIIATVPGPAQKTKTKRPPLDDRHAVAAFIRTRISRR